MLDLAHRYQGKAQHIAGELIAILRQPFAGAHRITSRNETELYQVEGILLSLRHKDEIRLS